MNRDNDPDQRRTQRQNRALHKLFEEGYSVEELSIMYRTSSPKILLVLEAYFDNN